MERRRLQIVGGSSYMVSLPKSWIKRNNLKRGDELILIEFEDHLRIMPNNSKSRVVRIRLPRVGDEFIKRLFYSLYIQGSDEIVVENVDTDLKDRIKESIKNLVGMEIVDVDSDKIVLKCLTTSFDVEKAVKRLCQIVVEMFECVEMFANTRELFNYIEKLEEEADKFYILSLRMIYKKVFEYSNTSELFTSVESRSFVKLLEEIADSLYDMATSFCICHEFLETLKNLKRLFEIAVDSYFKRDSLMSINLIEMANNVENQILSLCYPKNCPVKNRYCEVSPLLEVCRCIKSMGEMSFNTAVCKDMIS